METWSYDVEVRSRQHFKVYDSPLHGKGCFLEKGQFKSGMALTVYAPHRLPTRNLVKNDKILNLGGGWFLDGEGADGCGHLVNHSFEPNAQFDSGGVLHLIQDVDASLEPQEILVDYGIAYWYDKLCGEDYDLIPAKHQPKINHLVRELFHKRYPKKGQKRKK